MTEEDMCAYCENTIIPNNDGGCDKCYTCPSCAFSCYICGGFACCLRGLPTWDGDQVCMTCVMKQPEMQTLFAWLSLRKYIPELKDTIQLIGKMMYRSMMDDDDDQIHSPVFKC